MKPETSQLLDDTRRRLFESDEFRVSRELVQWVETNSGEPDDVDEILDRIERFAPAMQQWADSFNGSHRKITD